VPRHIRFVLFVAALVLFLAFSSTPGEAGPRDNPPPVPGWTHTEVFTDDSPQKHGVLLSGNDVARSSPNIAEIDGNPANGKEVTVGGIDGMLYVYASNGQLLWSTNVLPDPSCISSSPGDHFINGKPGVGELYGDGRPYVVVGYGETNPTSTCDGGLVAYDGATGRLAWRFSLTAWAAQEGYVEDIFGVTSSPALADTDGDGLMEVGFGGFDRNIYLLNADGSVRWYYHAADTIWSSPSFIDIDSDPALEMVIGSDITENLIMVPPTQNGGYVYAFNTQPVQPARVEFRDPGQRITLWRTDLDQAIYSSPAIADIMEDSPGLELAIGAGCYHPNDSVAKRGTWVKIMRLSDGAILQTLNAPACVQSSPALGDLDEDGDLEIAVTVMGADRFGGDGLSRIVAWNVDNPTPIWQHVPGDPNSGLNDAYGGDLQSTVIADLDGNGSLEVIYSNFWSVGILNGHDGTPLTCQNTSCGSQLSMFAWETVKSTPAIGDVNLDGQLDVIIGGGHTYAPDRGALYAWTGFAGLLNSYQGSLPAYSAPWPQFRHNAQNLGVLIPRELMPVPPISTLVARDGSFQTRQYSLSFSTSDGSPLNWTVDLRGDIANLVNLNRTSGTEQDTLQVAINGDGVPVGTYTGSLLMQETNGTLATEVPVTIQVAEELEAVFLPLVRP
jgi:hypothetical protein